ncbi:MAG: asparagine--tRNA ligase [Candidatus Micrarchaeota archaeon]|nr:asparagine--tRNA ligase [Candidatus Micrarchaeota archaeon]
MDVYKDQFVEIKDILDGKYEQKIVKIRGWVYRARASQTVAFVVLRDSTGIIQCAAKKENSSELYQKAKDVYLESSLMIEGIVKKDERAPGGWELEVKEIEYISKGEPFLISKDKSTEFLLDIRHLWLRSQKLTKVFKLRHFIVKYLREFLEKEGFFELPPPIITQSACEGGATVFELKYFDQKAYLSQSGQLYAESYIYALEKVYVFGPSFRAEPSRTVRHLTEYWHLEPEMAYYNQEMNMQLQEKMIVDLCQRLAKEQDELLEQIGQEPKKLKKITSPFERISYKKAIEKCQELGLKIEYGQDLGADEEYALTKDKEKPIFIHNHPKEFKAFYMREDPANPGTVLSDDMLAPAGHGEIIGGSERIWDEKELVRRIKEQGLKEEDYRWYIDLRKYGSVPHSGFGVGIERLVKWIANLEHIRDAIPYPRVINRVYP